MPLYFLGSAQVDWNGGLLSLLFTASLIPQRLVCACVLGVCEGEMIAGVWVAMRCVWTYCTLFLSASCVRYAKTGALVFCAAASAAAAAAGQKLDSQALSVQPTGVDGRARTETAGCLNPLNPNTAKRRVGRAQQRREISCHELPVKEKQTEREMHLD